jgi:hypothetical protein
MVIIDPQTYYYALFMPLSTTRAAFCGRSQENGPRLGRRNSLIPCGREPAYAGRVRFPRSPLLALYERLNGFPDRP